MPDKSSCQLHRVMMSLAPLIAMYKALGGGWELREGHNFISEENRNAMEERTNWGDLLEPEQQ